LTVLDIEVLNSATIVLPGLMRMEVELLDGALVVLRCEFKSGRMVQNGEFRDELGDGLLDLGFVVLEVEATI
jgi:hypothetical protein